MPTPDDEEGSREEGRGNGPVDNGEEEATPESRKNVG